MAHTDHILGSGMAEKYHLPLEKERIFHSFVLFLPVQKPFIPGFLFDVERLCEDQCLLYMYIVFHLHRQF